MAVLYGGAGLLLAALSVLVLNQMPARCFCDYDEQPGEQHLAPRVTLKKQGCPAGLFLCTLLQK